MATTATMPTTVPATIAAVFELELELDEEGAPPCCADAVPELAEELFDDIPPDDGVPEFISATCEYIIITIGYSFYISLQRNVVNQERKEEFQVDLQSELCNVMEYFH